MDGGAAWAAVARNPILPISFSSSTLFLPDDMDGSAWKEAAACNPILAAAEIYFMARPLERVPWRHLFPNIQASTSSSSSQPRPPPDRWGHRGRRARKARRKGLHEEKAKADGGGRASPATPLSWLASSSASGSEAEEVRCGDSVAATGTRDVGSAAAEGGCGAGGHGRVEVETIGEEKASMRLEKAISSLKESRRQRRKITVMELREFELSFLQKNMKLKEELELQRITQKMLVEENSKLKRLESELHCQVVQEKSMVSVVDEEAQPTKRRRLPFDLNLPFSEDSNADHGNSFEQGNR